jgi:hypothetical protein
MKAPSKKDLEVISTFRGGRFVDVTIARTKKRKGKSRGGNFSLTFRWQSPFLASTSSQLSKSIDNCRGAINA